VVGVPVTVVYERNGREARRDVTVGTRARYEYRLGADETAGERQVERRRRILEGG